MRISVLFAALLLVVSACDDESTPADQDTGTDVQQDVQADTQTDPQSDAVSGCPDAAVYCNSIGALRSTGSSIACDGSATRTDSESGPYQEVSCTNPEDAIWNVWDSEGFEQEDIGGHICVTTVVDEHNTTHEIPEDDYICKRGFHPVWTDASSRCHREFRENHFANSPTCTGWLQCLMTEEITEGACGE